ncbi:MAG: hypothetical protein ABR521_00415 [Gaiellaceae bacterium]
MRSHLLVAVASALVLAVGTGGAAATPCRSCTGAKQNVSMPTIEGATHEQHALLREILARIETTGIRLIRIGPRDNKDWDELRSLGIEKPPNYAPPNYVEIVVTYSRSADPEMRWKAELLAHAFHAGSEQRGLPRVIWFSEPPEGSTLSSWGGPEHEEEAESHAAKLLSEAELDEFVQAARRAAEASGAELERLEVRRPHDHALLLVLHTDDAHEFLQRRLAPLAEKLEVLTENTAGYYLELRDADGSAWYRARTITLHSSGGSGGPRQDLRCVDPFFHGTLSVPEPPPCQP